jgi:sugar phosphate isomerase/epimerase
VKPIFLSLAAALALSMPGESEAAETGLKHPVGLQLYSLRADFTKNVPAALAKVESFGVKNVELAGTYGLSPAKFGEMLKAHGLTAVSGHFSFDDYKKDPEGIAKQAAELGLKYAGCAWIPHKDNFDEAEAKDAVTVFNKAGAALAKHGIKFFYHCHGYEFDKHGDGTFMDLLMKETDPKLVSFEMDVFWVKFPGEDPVKWLAKYPGRWELMHIKDMKKGLKTGSNSGGTDVANNVVAGTGQMDWKAILSTAEKTGVTQYFIEDESAVAGEQIPETLKYLHGLKW